MRKWHISSANINFEANILLFLPLYILKNLRKYFSAIYRQNYNLLFHPPIDYLADKGDLSKIALDFAWSLSESQGFVAHHYDDNVGIILTVKGEVIIFEKSVFDK